MKPEEREKYIKMLSEINSRLSKMRVTLPYGLSNEDKAFLELVYELTK